MLIKEIMTKEVVTVEPETSLKDLVEVFKKNRFRGVPVVTQKGLLVGVITLTDVLRLLRDINYWGKVEKLAPEIAVRQAFIREKESATVGEKMTRSIMTVSENDTVDYLVDLMTSRNIHTIPVVKDGILVGVVGATDIVYASFFGV